MANQATWTVVVLLVVLSAAGCAGAAPSVSTAPEIASYEEYHVVACQAWDALDRAVGNPDTGSGSELSRVLDEAATTGDGVAADRVVTDIKAQLATGRRHLAVAGTWKPRASTVAQLDRVFAAFEAMTDAKRAVAKGEPDAVDPQLAFEQAGGVEAWYAMFDTLSAQDMASGKPCPNVPVTP